MRGCETKLQLLLTLFCPGMILGCASTAPDLNGTTKILTAAPVVVETTAIRCPRVSTRDRRAFNDVVIAPEAPDATTKDGAPAISVGSWQRWTDRYKLALQTTKQTGRRLIRESDRCLAKP